MDDEREGTQYVVVVAGTLTDAVRRATEARGLTVTEERGRLVFRGRFSGLVALNDLLFALDDLGLTLLSVRQSA
ncbi:hypothetical protein [Mumia zhuanghuii]|uniref:Uncharacterized protein n=1 Tax=Mumia zhuanghuii TaxID=2585211 RepID=A0A5C4MFP0_9ACTN|nr:hypothetical protein [Mumia zhuanghuii]TNC42558.1 hypothetical protein FHE65_20690 [Mumia zhuanghuii]TNC43073.1 hypothetical protein FHE65_19605 [Mumia zhuanghuii]